MILSLSGDGAFLEARNLPSPESATILFLVNGVPCLTARGPFVEPVTVRLLDLQQGDATARTAPGSGLLQAFARDAEHVVLDQGSLGGVTLPQRRTAAEGRTAPRSERLVASTLHVNGDRHTWRFSVGELLSDSGDDAPAGLWFALMRVVFDSNLSPPKGESLAEVHLVIENPNGDAAATGDDPPKPEGALTGLAPRDGGVGPAIPDHDRSTPAGRRLGIGPGPGGGDRQRVPQRGRGRPPGRRSARPPVLRGVRRDHLGPVVHRPGDGALRGVRFARGSARAFRPPRALTRLPTTPWRIMGHTPVSRMGVSTPRGKRLAVLVGVSKYTRRRGCPVMRTSPSRAASSAA